MFTSHHHIQEFSPADVVTDAVMMHTYSERLSVSFRKQQHQELQSLNLVDHRGDT